MLPDDISFITDEASLRALHHAPMSRATDKVLRALDRHCRRIIALSPFCVISTQGPHGADISPRGAHARARMGIALVPEGRRLFASLTVEENLLLSRSAGRAGRWTLEAVMEAFPNLKARRRSLAGTLSGGEQQATAIGRALMTNPEIILLDEVSLGLSPLVVGRVYEQLEALKGSGVAIVLVEQDLKRAMATASRAICMLEGAIAVEGATAELTHEEVTRAYFGLRHSAERGAPA